MKLRLVGLPLGLLALAAHGCASEATNTADAAPRDAAPSDASVDQQEPLDIIVRDSVVSNDRGPATDAPDNPPPGFCEEMGGAACFVLPSAPIAHADGPIVDVCMESPAASSTRANLAHGPVASPLPTALIPNAVVAHSASPEFSAPAPMVTANGMGDYRMMLPAGTPSRTNFRVTAEGYLPSYSIAQRFNVTADDGGRD